MADDRRMAGVGGDNLRRQERLVPVRELREQNASLTRRVARLEQALNVTRAEPTTARAELIAARAARTAARTELAAARENSSTSSKPPSSDITAPPTSGKP